MTRLSALALLLAASASLSVTNAAFAQQAPTGDQGGQAVRDVLGRAQSGAEREGFAKGSRRGGDRGDRGGYNSDY